MPRGEVSYLKRIAEERAGKRPGLAPSDMSPLDRLTQERAKAAREEGRAAGQGQTETLASSTPETQPNIEPRLGDLSEHQATAQSLELTLISANGDAEDGIPWGLYAGRALVRGPEWGRADDSFYQSSGNGLGPQSRPAGAGNPAGTPSHDPAAQQR